MHEMIMTRFIDQEVRLQDGECMLIHLSSERRCFSTLFQLYLKNARVLGEEALWKHAVRCGECHRLNFARID